MEYEVKFYYIQQAYSKRFCTPDNRVLQWFCRKLGWCHSISMTFRPLLFPRRVINLAIKGRYDFSGVDRLYYLLVRILEMKMILMLMLINRSSGQVLGLGF